MLIIASVTNPPGVDQFISSVDAITLDSGNAQTLPDFTPGTMTPVAAADVDWTQPFTLTTGNIFDTIPVLLVELPLLPLLSMRELVLDLKLDMHLIHLLIVLTGVV